MGTNSEQELMVSLQELCDEASSEAMEAAKKLTKKELVDQIGTMASLIVSFQALEAMQTHVIEEQEANESSPYLWALGGAFVTFVAAIFVAL